MRLIGKKRRERGERERGTEKGAGEEERREIHGAEETGRERCSEPNTQRRLEKITRNRSSSMEQVCGIIVSPKNPKKKHVS